MLSYVWKLLRARWRITWNNIWRASRRRKIGYCFAAFGLTVLAIVLVVASWGVLSLLRRPQAARFITPDLIRSIPVLFTSATFLAGLLTNFGVLLQSLYLSGDMEFLLAAPVPTRAVFVTKLIQAVLPNFLFMSLFNLPALIGLGLAQSYNVIYFAMLPVTLVLLMLAGAGISAIAVIWVVRLVPARRIAEVLGLIGGVTSILCSQSSQLMRLSGMERNAPSSAQIQALTRVTAQLDTPYSPLAWPGRMLVALGEGQWLAALLLVGLTLALTLGAFGLSLVTAERLYISGWARTQGVAVRKTTRVRDEHRRPTSTTRLLPAPLRALVAKDLRLLTRDLRNLSQLVTPIVLGVVYTLSLVRSSERVPVTPIGSNVVSYGSLGMALFMAWMFSIRLSMGGIGMEGKRYWLLKVAPLRPETLLAGKFVVAYLPSLAIGQVFLVASTILSRQPLAALPYNVIALAATVAALCAVYLALGASNVNLKWENPRHVTSFATGCLGWIIGVAITTVISGVFVGMPILFSVFDAPALLAQIVGLAVGLVLCIGIMLIALLFARARVPLVGEE